MTLSFRARCAHYLGEAYSALRLPSPPTPLPKSGRRWLWLCLFLFTSLSAQAFDLAALQQKMQQSPVVRGDFVQEKHISGLPIPLIGLGQFCLSTRQGLLWDFSAPIKQRLRITAQGLAREISDNQWQLESGLMNRQQTQLFLAVLQGDTSELQRQFQLALTGSSERWQLTLTPKSALLKQIFTRIEINGGALLSQIELLETSGERTLIKLLNAKTASALTAAEAKAFE